VIGFSELVTVVEDVQLYGAVVTRTVLPLVPSRSTWRARGGLSSTTYVLPPTSLFFPPKIHRKNRTGAVQYVSHVNEVIHG